jgi:hypothetical protein
MVRKSNMTLLRISFAFVPALLDLYDATEVDV